METIKQIPYGVADFESVMTRHLYYVDKTMYLDEIERQPDTLIFIRPRRFGKSLFISMMRAYYDKSKAKDFDDLFGSLWIGSHPTPLRNHYQVLYLDFSKILGNIDVLEEKFDQYLRRQLDDFVRRYADDYPDYFIKDFFESTSGADKLIMISIQADRLRIPMYLIIDEYDNFTNVVLSEHGEEIYHNVTHVSGFYREVFKKFKGMFERIFLTGVSPVTLDDLTSGFNIGWNVSMAPELEKMLGFSTEDVREMFRYYKEVEMLPADCDIEAMITEMKPWYDNYCFAKECLDSDVRVFNCDMVLYYLRNYMRRGQAPEQMLDPNTKTDYNKMKKLLQLDKLDGDRKGVIKTIAENGEIIGTIEESFPAKELTDPNIFVSLLFYYGMLTIKGTLGEMLILGIPNNNVRKQYYNYLLELYQEEKCLNIANLRAMFTYMAFDGKWEEALGFMVKAYADISSVRDGIEAERNLLGFFMAYLSLTSYYYTAPELELSHGYCDFFLLPDLTHYPTKHSYIIELKVLSKNDFNAIGKDGRHTKAELQWQVAVEQIHRYAEAPRVEALRQGTQLHKIIMQFEGWELKRMEEV